MLFLRLAPDSQNWFGLVEGVSPITKFVTAVFYNALGNGHHCNLADGAAALEEKQMPTIKDLPHRRPSHRPRGAQKQVNNSFLPLYGINSVFHTGPSAPASAKKWKEYWQ